MKTVRYPAHIRQLRANLAGTRKALAAHRKMCAQCRNARAVADLSLQCNTGYDFSRDEWRFIRALERAGHSELTMVGDQLALF